MEGFIHKYILLPFIIFLSFNLSCSQVSMVLHSIVDALLASKAS